jgi:hypothetical protein
MESDDEDDDDAMEARRERLRMLARQRRALEVVEQVHALPSCRYCMTLHGKNSSSNALILRPVL